MKLSRNTRCLLSGIMVLTTAAFFAAQDRSDALAGYPNTHNLDQGSGCVNETCPIAVFRPFSPNMGVDWVLTWTCVYTLPTNQLLTFSTPTCNDPYNSGCCNNLDTLPKCVPGAATCPLYGTPPPPPAPVSS
jgi:hypothetical protein